MSTENSVDWRKLVYRQVESDTLDYKAPLNWIKLSHTGKAKFVRHCLAFANTKGGYVVVGVQEDASGHPSVYTGLNADEVKSFDPSTVGQFVNRMVDPPIDFTIESTSTAYMAACRTFRLDHGESALTTSPANIN